MSDKDFVASQWAYVSGGFGDSLRAVKIERITKSGQIIIANSHLKFRQGGSMIGGDRWSRSYLYQPTPELDRKYLEQVAFNLFEKENIKNLPDEKLEKLVKILKEGREKKVNSVNP